MPRRNSHVMDGTFLLHEPEYRANIKVNEKQAFLELVVGLAILVLLISICLMVGWAS